MHTSLETFRLFRLIFIRLDNYNLIPGWQTNTHHPDTQIALRDLIFR